MKKLMTVLLCAALGLPLFAAQDNTLAFYQRQAVMKAPKQKQDRAFATALARDVQVWIRLHPQNADIKNALLLQSNLYQRAQQYARGLIALYQIRFYFPTDEDITVLSSGVENIMEELNRSEKAQALKLLAVNTSQAQTFAEKHAILLESLVKAGLPDVYEPVCDLFEDFFVQYPQDINLDKIILLYADWHRQNNNFYAAISEYKKVDELFPDTAYKAASLRMTADVYAMDLRDYETADALYNQVLRKYPNSAEQGIVYKHLGIMEENRKNYSLALGYYDKAITDLGAQPSAREAWIGKADVLMKTKAYQAAYDTLVRGAERFTGTESVYVPFLLRAADIAEGKLSNVAQKTAALEKIMLFYPQNPQAPEILYELGSAYEDQATTAQAIVVYKQLVINYPTDKYASRAQNRLKKLEKEVEKTAK